MSNNKDVQKRIDEARKTHKNRKNLRQTIETVGLTAALLLTKNSVQAQEIKVADAKNNLTEQTAHTQQKDDNIISKAEKMFDMYRLSYFDDTLYNLVSPTEKEKCKEFFDQYPTAKDVCNEAHEYVKNNRGLRDFNTAEKYAINNGNHNLRSNLLTYLANNPKASETMNKIQSSEYANEVVNELTSYEKEAAQIWSIYVAVEQETETGIKAPEEYKKFLQEHPICSPICKNAYQKAGIGKEQLANTTITDVNAGIYYNGKMNSLTQQFSQLLENCDNLGVKIKVPHSTSTYQATARDFQQTR